MYDQLKERESATAVHNAGDGCCFFFLLSFPSFLFFFPFHVVDSCPWYSRLDQPGSAHMLRRRAPPGLLQRLLLSSFFSSFSLADLFNVPVLQLTLMNESSSIFTNNKTTAYTMVSTSDRAKTDEQQINFHQYACDLRLHLVD
jgi:hypothetical protein